MQYQYFRLFLTERDQRSIFEDRISRQDYLLDVLATEQIDFVGRQTAYSYAHIGESKGVVVGRIGRQKSEIRNDGPETGFEETSEDQWHAVNIFIDTNGDSDDQKLIVGSSLIVGKPTSIRESLINSSQV